MSQEVYEILEQAYPLKNSPVKNALLEEAIRIADSVQDDELSVQCRMELIDSATFSGGDEKALVAFAWCLAKFDEAPELFDVYDLLWRYKWIATVASFSHVPRSRIDSLEDDMEKRFLREGYNLRPVHETRSTNGLYLGEHKRVAKYEQLSKSFPRDWMANCEACEMSHSVHTASFLGDYEDSVEKAIQLFDSNMSCSCVPQNVYGHILYPLLQLGRIEEATNYHNQGYQQIAGDPDYLETAAEHMVYLASVGNFRRGISLFTRQLPSALSSFLCREKYVFFLSSGLLFEQLQIGAKKPTRKMRLPKEFQLHNPAGEYAIADLCDWNLNQAKILAQQFDTRNENTWYSDNIRATRELVQRVQNGT